MMTASKGMTAGAGGEVAQDEHRQFRMERN